MFSYLQCCTVEILATMQFLVYQYDFIVFTSIEVKSGILTGRSAPNWSPQSVCSSASFGIQAVHNASVMTQLDGGHPILADDINKKMNYANNLKGMRQQCSNIDTNSTSCRNTSQKWTFVFLFRRVFHHNCYHVIAFSRVSNQRQSMWSLKYIFTTCKM